MAEKSSRGAEDIICELIEKSFSARTVGEQKEILQHKKPQPKLGDRTANRQFQDAWCAKKKLTNIVLLAVPFVCSRKIANVDKKGYTDMCCFLSDCRKHERSNCHLEAYKK